MRYAVMAIDRIRERRWAVATLVFLLVVSVVTTLTVAGCNTAPVYPPGVASEVRDNKLRLERYLELRAEGKTTPEQDARMLEACKKAFTALDTVMSKGD